MGISSSAGLTPDRIQYHYPWAPKNWSTSSSNILFRTHQQLITESQAQMSTLSTVTTGLYFLLMKLYSTLFVRSKRYLKKHAIISNFPELCSCSQHFKDISFCTINSPDFHFQTSQEPVPSWSWLQKKGCRRCPTEWSVICITNVKTGLCCPGAPCAASMAHLLF